MIFTLVLFNKWEEKEKSRLVNLWRMIDGNINSNICNCRYSRYMANRKGYRITRATTSEKLTAGEEYGWNVMR